MRRFRAPLAGLLPAVLLCIMTLPDPLLAARLWEISKDMTGVDPGLAPAT